MEHLLEVKNLAVTYGKNEAVSNISFHLNKGDIVAIIGESGSGKTTLLRAISGLLPENGSIVEGKLVFEQNDLTNASFKEWSNLHGRKMGMIFQNPEKSLSPLNRIENQFYECLRVSNKKITKSQSKDIAITILKDLHFDDPERILKCYPFELSGGMCQRVAIGLAILNDPLLLFADEPTSALDVASQKTTIETLIELNEKKGTSILLVTHNIGVAYKIADYIGVMYQGKLVEWSEAKEIVKNPKHHYTKRLIDAVPKLERRNLYE